MHSADINNMAALSLKKIRYMDNSKLGYFILSVFAGIYVGFGIILIFAVGAPYAAQSSPALKLIMGTAFGVALTLVIFAGSELFTGNNMYCVIGGLVGSVRWWDVGRLFWWCYVGNLAGSVALAWVVAQTGVLSGPAQAALVTKITSSKMNLAAWPLFLRAVLCNMLVCLACWTSSRTKNDTAKILLIFWCLFAFIGSGFEHSVANMTLLTLGLLLPHGPSITLLGYAWNLSIVSVGNFVGGGLVIGALYWLVSPERAPAGEGARAQVEQEAETAEDDLLLTGASEEAA